ncbi:hypothetical protein HHI36_021372 [Cryptolaemus montrouzieri]|uniref:Uncharacterized protein n=1 Tax=Cryptolaemus montrouzieri TaxID=559131 RepID=A0ABD2MWR5_9CUCU
MQCLAKIASNFLKKSLAIPTVTNEVSVRPAGGIFDVFTRNIIRNHFPKPSETKRIRRHGFKNVCQLLQAEEFS